MILREESAFTETWVERGDEEMIANKVANVQAHQNSRVLLRNAQVL
jgi:hypothetical protein